jgi:anti-sigma B factor antagonist
VDFAVSGPDEVDGPAGPGSIRVIQAKGELDIATVPYLEEVLVPAVAAGGRVILDGTDVTFTDSTGVSLLVKAHKTALDASGRLDLVLVAPAVLKVLDMSGLIEILNIHPTVEQARQAG